jgi:four helix bundle protein
MRDYHHLDIWDRSMSYAAGIYEFSARLPDLERYNLTAQIRKAAISVPLNIAEGSGCQTDAEFARFISYSYRSLKEVVTCLELCQWLYPDLASAEVLALIGEGDHTLIAHGS